MPKSRNQLFETLITEGALLPSDFLQRLAQRDHEVPGLTPDAYHLGSGERLNEAVSRSWNRLLAVWKNFTVVATQITASDPSNKQSSKITHKEWLLPFFQELGYGRLPTAKPFKFEGRDYEISHTWQNTPIHLVSFRAGLDNRSENIIGARTTTPHSMVQEFLNRSEGHLWGIVSNGYRLRLLRDNASLTRQAYVEFDLQSMMQGEVYADFALLWLLLHQSRVEGERPELCWLEKWTQEARQRGARALDQLRDGVQDAISALGSGFLAHPANAALRDKLNGGTLTKQDYFRQLLRVVYRFLFLFVAEDRELLFTDQVPGKTREQYLRHYSMSRLRRMALRLGGTQHADLWHVVRLIFRSLGSDTGCAALGLPALGSFLWSDKATPELNDCQLANRVLLQAIRALAFAEQNKIRRPIDYKNIGTEELGSVYESLLEQHPDVHVPTAKFILGTHAGHERKTTGSYYTPPSLVQCLLDSALEPVLAEACKKPNPEQAILNLKVCDKACGSGHFLIAAAHRIARRLAAVRTGEDEPAPAALRHALRDVIGHCIYGVDINPMAVELCKFALWLEAVEPGRPLSFLDHHIQCGNSLIGATPALIRNGIPDEAFDPIEGDEKEACRKLKKRNQGEREGLGGLFTLHDAENQQALVQAASAVNNLPDDSVADVHRKEQAFQQAHGSYDFLKAKDVADLLCAAFVIRKSITPGTTQPFGITTRHLTDFAQGSRVPEGVLPEAKGLAEQYRFFHWYLAFPDVFKVPTASTPQNVLCGWDGGFDVILGNPPWEQTELEETEWFAVRRPDIALAPNDSERKKMIAALRLEAPELHQAFVNARREYDGATHFARRSGRYPLCGQGRINTASLFAELSRNVCRPIGRVGCIVPTGIATDDTTKEFFNDLLRNARLISLFGFHNGKGLFPDVRPHQQFCLLTLGENRSSAAEFAFSLSEVSELNDADRRFSLTPSDIELVNPNTNTCPIFPTKRHMQLTKALYQRVPVLMREAGKPGNPWGISFKQGLFNMATDSGLFRTKSQLEADGWELDADGKIFARNGEEYVPLYDAKMIQQYNHRAADLGFSGHQFRKISKEGASPEQLADPSFSPSPIYWVSKRAVTENLQGWSRRWMLGFKDVTGTTSTSIGVFTIIPLSGVGHKLPLIFSNAQPSLQTLLLANLNSLMTEYVLRLKFQGLSLSFYYLKQLPVLPPDTYAQSCAWAGQGQTLQAWLLPRVLELTYTAWDLEAFAQDCGWSGPPFRWDEERRFLLRCELDAAFFHLYGITPDDAAYILDTFPIVKRKDESKWGTYRTKDTILEIYAALAAAAQSGQPYQSRLNPPPADPGCCHPPKQI